MTADPTAPIEALRKRLPPGWTVRYGIRELRDPDTNRVRMHLFRLDVITLSGALFLTSQAVTEAFLEQSIPGRAETERVVWERLARQFPLPFPSDDAVAGSAGDV